MFDFFYFFRHRKIDVTTGNEDEKLPSAVVRQNQYPVLGVGQRFSLLSAICVRVCGVRGGGGGGADTFQCPTNLVFVCVCGSWEGGCHTMFKWRWYMYHTVQYSTAFVKNRGTVILICNHRESCASACRQTNQEENTSTKVGRRSLRYFSSLLSRSSGDNQLRQLSCLLAKSRALQNCTCVVYVCGLLR